MPYELHITGRDDGEVNYRLYSGVFVVGRKDCPVVLGNDKSIRCAPLPVTACLRLLVTYSWRGVASRCWAQRLGGERGTRACGHKRVEELTPPNTTAGNTRRYASMDCPLKR
jgi:hypothetical protein